MRLTRSIFVGASLLAFAAGQAPAAAAKPVARELVYTSTRSYQLVLPGDRKPEAGILLLHGAQTPEARRRVRDELFQPFFDRFSATHPVAVAYADGRVGTCAWDRSLACWPMRAPWEETRFLTDALDALRAETKVSRWIAVGFSNGGYFLGSLIQSGERLPADAAVIIVGGQAWSGGPSFAWAPDLTIVTGKADAENRPQGLELHADLERAGYGKLARLEHKEFDGGHELPEAIVSETLGEIIASTGARLRAEAAARFAGLDGCFLLYDLRAERLLFESDPELCARRLPACSTFKIPLAAMAFDAGVLADERSGFAWDGIERPIKAWNGGHDASSWMKHSVVWFSQRLTPKLGAERVARYLDDFEYGSKDMSGGLDKAWLTVASFLAEASPTLRISPREQLRFLSRLWTGKLRLAPRAVELTKKIITLELSPAGYRLHGKTGSGFAGSPDGPRIGWFVAQLARADEDLIAVLAFTERARDPKAAPFAGAQARAMLQELLATAGKW